MQPIKVEKTDSQVDACASMMSDTDPWKAIGFSKEQCIEALKQPEIRIDVIANEDGIIAFLASVKRGVAMEPMIEYLCVRSDLRGEGIGSRMVQFFEEVLNPDADNLYMLVSDINPRAKTLYERLGYVAVGELPNYNLPGQTEFLMRKSRGPRQTRRQERRGI